MLVFLFRKKQIFWAFIFNKKIIISHKKSRNKSNLKSENKLFSGKKLKKQTSFSFSLFPFSHL